MVTIKDSELPRDWNIWLCIHCYFDLLTNQTRYKWRLTYKNKLAAGKLDCIGSILLGELSLGAGPHSLLPLQDAFLHLLEVMRRVGKRFAGDLALIIFSARPLTDLSPACVVQDFKISCVRGNVLAEGLLMRATSQASFNQCYNAQGTSLNMASN